MILPRSLSLLGSIFCLNYITVTIRKICLNNSFFTQLLSFVFLPSAVLQCNHHQKQIDESRIYRKTYIFFFKSDQQLYKHLSCSVRRRNFSARRHHHVGLPELPLHRAAGKSSQCPEPSLNTALTTSFQNWRVSKMFTDNS